MGTRAKVRLTGDGRVEIENLETHQLADLRISAESATGEARTVFNAVFSELASSIPGLTKVVTRIMTDPTRYLRLGDEDIVLIDHDQENLLRYEAIVGARANRLGTILNLFAAEDLNVKELKNATEAANYAEVLTTLSQQELILQSSLAVGARVLPPSLLDFLV
jgi:flagellin-like hook-associated protein FlgL